MLEHSRWRMRAGFFMVVDAAAQFTIANLNRIIQPKVDLTHAHNPFSHATLLLRLPWRSQLWQ